MIAELPRRLGHALMHQRANPLSYSSSLRLLTLLSANNRSFTPTVSYFAVTQFTFTCSPDSDTSILLQSHSPPMAQATDHERKVEAATCQVITLLTRINPMAASPTTIIHTDTARMPPWTKPLRSCTPRQNGRQRRRRGSRRMSTSCATGGDGVLI